MDPHFLSSHMNLVKPILSEKILLSKKKKKKKMFAKPITMYDQTFILKSGTQPFFVVFFHVKQMPTPKFS